MTDTHVAHEESHGGTHPDEKQYVVVALVLAVLTAIEVGVYYIDALPNGGLVVILAVLAILKFAGVVLYFMHLRFDSKIFRNLFLTGLVLAMIVYAIVLAATHVFSGGFPYVRT